jgi:hypothetical protein
MTMWKGWRKITLFSYAIALPQTVPKPGAQIMRHELTDFRMSCLRLSMF